jgi:hypothetical protein
MGNKLKVFLQLKLRINNFVNLLKIRKSYQYFLLYLFLITLSLIFLITKNIEIYVYVLFYLIGFGWSIVFFKKSFNILEHLMISPIISFSIFIFFVSIFVIFKVKLDIFIGFLFYGFSLIIFFLEDIFKERNLNLKIEKSDILLIVMTIAAISSKLFSVLDMLVPNLSDSITHSYYAKQIIDTGKLSFYYSPGIHIFSAYSTMFGGVSVEKGILYLTNFFSAYSGVVVYLYLKKIFRDTYTALSSSLLFSLGVGLTLFFYSGGKNALVVGISSLLLFILISSLNRKNYSWKYSLLSSILLFCTFLVHYPLGIIASVYWGSIFLVDIKKNIKFNLLIGLGIVGGLLYFFCSFLDFSNSNPEASVGSFADFSIPPNLYEYFRSYFFSIIGAAKNYAFQGYDRVIYYSPLLGLLVVIFGFIKSKYSLEFLIILIWSSVSFFIGFILTFFPFLTIVVETYMLSLFIFLYIYLSFLISLIYKFLVRFVRKDLNFYIFTIVFTASFTFLAYSTYNTYKYFAPMLSVVRQEDIQIFEWLENNTKDEDKILINSFEATPGLVGPSDSGGWITVFSGNQISSPFWEFSHDSTIQNLEKYIELQVNLSNCETLRYFLENGFKYYFQGAAPIRDVLGSPENLEENGWNLVYSEGGAYLFEIPTTCQ